MPTDVRRAGTAPGEQQAPLASTWTTVDGLAVHARVSTLEPAHALHVVLVHGIGVAGAYFVPTLVRLASDYRTYAVDLPGFGESDRPQHVLTLPELAESLVAWMEGAGLDRAAVVGNSFGCQVVLEFAVRHPERVERVVLLGPTMDRAARSAPRQIARWLANGVFERPSQLPILLRDYRAAGVRRPWRTFRYALADRVEEKLAHVSAPTLVVRGERDLIVSQRWAEEVSALLPHGRLIVIPGAAHAVNYNAPDAVARVLRAFLAGGE